MKKKKICFGTGQPWEECTSVQRGNMTLRERNANYHSKLIPFLLSSLQCSNCISCDPGQPSPLTTRIPLQLAFWLQGKSGKDYQEGSYFHLWGWVIYVFFNIKNLVGGNKRKQVCNSPRSFEKRTEKSGSQVQQVFKA